MAATILEPLTFSSPRLDLAIAASPRSSLSVRRELGLGFHPRLAGLRVSRRFQKVPTASTGAKIPKADRRSTVVCEVRETASKVPDVNKETWRSHVLECTTPVIVEFWAPWCGPCRVIHPVIAKLANTYAGKLHCFNVNIDECPYLTSQYNIRSIPTIMIFKDGEKKDAIIGAVPESTLISFLGKFLGK